jgi:Tol biopolymer transport system component
MLYQNIEGEQNWGIVMTNLDGSQEQLIAHQGNWSSLSPDGSRVVYSSTNGTLHLVDLASGQDTALGSAAGYNAVWSPDGTQIAYIEHLSINIINVDGSNPRKLGGKDHYSLAGWSADGTKLYVTLLGADGFTLQSLDLTMGEFKSLFTLEDSSRKAPFATISPSGEWIAYRASDNSSLYLMQMDGSDEHLVLMRPADAISSIVWSNDSNWLGVSLVNSPTDERTVVLLQPWSCQAYLLPNLHGEFEGLFFS